MDSSVISLFVIAAVVFIALKMLPRLVAGVPFIEPKTVHERMQNDPKAVMIDVRTPEEFEQGHVPDSLNVQPVDLGEDLESKRPFMDEKVYVICLTSQRAAMAAKTLKNLGFTNVSVVAGGFTKWRRQKLPST